MTTKHAIAYEIYNQHNYKIRYVIGHQQPNKSPIRSVVVTKFENGSAYLNRGAYWNRRAHWNESANSRGALIRNRRAYLQKPNSSGGRGTYLRGGANWKEAAKSNHYGT